MAQSRAWSPSSLWLGICALRGVCSLRIGTRQVLKDQYHRALPSDLFFNTSPGGVVFHCASWYFILGLSLSSGRTGGASHVGAPQLEPQLEPL
jgi:hypothetical protein